MKSLYDENARHTEAANNLCEMAYKALYPIFKTLADEGYSPRDLAHVISGAVLDLELDAVLSKDFTKK